MILRLVDGTTTINLTGGPIYRAAYVPVAPKPRTVEYAPGAMADGGEVSAVTRPLVTETCELSVVEDSGDELRVVLQSIETLFLGAIEYQNRRGGARLYLEFAAEDDDTVYRSEILWGTMDPGAETLSLWCDAAAKIRLTWQRRYYWEASAEVELSLANTHGTGTGGITIYNHYDAVHENFVHIASTAVVGVLPAPVRVEITNTYNVSPRLEDVFIGHNVYSSPASLNTILEGEDADTPGGAGTADGNCSNGEYKATASIGTTAAEAMTWTLDATTLGYCQGRWFRLLMRLRQAPGSGYYLQPRVSFPGGAGIADVAVMDEVQLDGNEIIQDLGVVQIPPWLQGLGAQLYPVDLNIYGRKATGSGTLEVDFVQLTPLDSYRVLRPRGYGASLNIRLADDGMGGWLWADGWSGAQKSGHYYGLGLPVQLVPGRAQRIYFLMTSTSAGAEIARTATVRVYYRPRRVTV